MPWILLTVGLLLIAVGAWGGPRTPRRRAGTRAGSQHTAAAAAAHMAEADVGGADAHGTHPAWEILTRPVDRSESASEDPEHRPWHLPSKQRWFLQGTSIGLGAGLVIGALMLMAQPAPPPDSAATAGTPTPSSTNAPTPSTPAPTASTPAATATGTSSPTPSRPADVRILVEPGWFAGDVAEKLKAEGLIQDEKKFVDRLIERKLDTHLKAGLFNIPRGSSVDTVIDILVGLQ